MRDPAEREAKANESRPASSTSIAWRRLWPLAGLAALMAIGYIIGGQKLMLMEKLVAFHDSFRANIDANPFTAIVVFVLVYASLVAMSVPGASFGTLGGGLMFGWFVGGLASIVAATTGAALVFLIARSALGETLAAKAGPYTARLRAGFQENALSYLLFMRLTPVFPFFVTNIVPAVLGVPFRTFVIGTGIGIIPGTFTYASVGAGLDSIVAAAKAGQAACRATAPAALCPLKLDIHTLLTPEIKIALAMLGLIALIPVAIKYWRRRGTAAGGRTDG